MTDLIKVAQIIGNFGVDGIVKVFSYFTNKNDIVDFTDDLVDENNKSFNIIHCRHHKSRVFLMRFTDIDDIDKAKDYLKQYIFIDASKLPELDNEFEFYSRDLIGLPLYKISDEVKTAEIKTIEKYLYGYIENVYNYGAGDIIEIKIVENELEEDNKESKMIEEVDKIRRFHGKNKNKESYRNLNKRKKIKFELFNFNHLIFPIINIKEGYGIINPPEEITILPQDEERDNVGDTD